MTISVRFVADTPRTAPFNMAADLYLMDRCREIREITVRFYTWNPPAITLGRLQCASEQLDLAALARDGVRWVRRPTGGRAVLHAEDLTYSCIFSRPAIAPGSTVAATYATISRALATGLRNAGIETSMQDSVSPLIKHGRAVKLPCFLAPNRNEIMVNGRKLIGSAQYRSAAAVLQHGSLPLTPAGRRLPRYLRLTHEEQQQQMRLLDEKSISLSEVNSDATVDAVIEALIAGFSEVFGGEAVARPWSDEELEGIERKMRSEEFREWYLADRPVRK